MPQLDTGTYVVQIWAFGRGLHCQTPDRDAMNDEQAPL